MLNVDCKLLLEKTDLLSAELVVFLERVFPGNGQEETLQTIKPERFTQIREDLDQSLKTILTYVSSLNSVFDILISKELENPDIFLKHEVTTLKKEKIQNDAVIQNQLLEMRSWLSILEQPLDYNSQLMSSNITVEMSDDKNVSEESTVYSTEQESYNIPDSQTIKDEFSIEYSEYQEDIMDS